MACFLLVQCGMHKTIKINNIETLVDEDIFNFLQDKTVSLNVKYKGSTYIYVMIPGHKDPTPLHRIVMGLDEKDGQCVDHINRNPLDNRRENLRVCVMSQNLYNQPVFKYKATSENPLVSKFKGVSWQKQRQRWKSYISIKNVYVHLLLTSSEHEAAYSYNVAAALIAGEFAYPNDGLSLTQEQKTYVETATKIQLRVKKIIS